MPAERRKTSAGLIEQVKHLLASSAKLAQYTRIFEPEQYLIREGEPNASIFILLEGVVELRKSLDGRDEVPVGNLHPGDLVGILSFTSEEPAFTSVKTKTKSTVLTLTRDEYKDLGRKNPALLNLIQPLLFENLAGRYRGVVELHLEVALLTKQLEQERNTLEATLAKLQATQSVLIQKEKMATLGQLVAGIAHELNNPAAAILRSVEGMYERMERAADESAPGRRGQRALLLKAGLKSAPLNTEEQNDKIEKVLERFPSLSRPLARIAAQLDRSTYEQIVPWIESALESRALDELTDKLDYFEIGSQLRSIRISAQRIGNIVKSLKSYSRPPTAAADKVDLREGINETLQLLANRLRGIRVKAGGEEIPPVRCVPGEINQVWTNIIANACDAMGGEGELTIEWKMSGKKRVRVEISDTGPGIDPANMPRLFDADFTTKNISGNFGLGLGLNIAKGIVEKHGGTIAAENLRPRGAKFSVVLPVD